MNERALFDRAGMAAADKPAALAAVLTNTVTGRSQDRIYFRAKKFFDFCQWVILSTAFAGISSYFLNHPVYALEYVACVTATLSVTALAFWHLARTLHANVAAALVNRLALRSRWPRGATIHALAVAIDAIILTGFIHMLHIFSSNLLARMDIVAG